MAQAGCCCADVIVTAPVTAAVAPANVAIAAPLPTTGGAAAAVANVAVYNVAVAVLLAITGADWLLILLRYCCCC